MDKKQAMEILRRRRPWAENIEAEEAAALRAAASDAELADCKASHEQFNARVHQELAAIPVPPELRDRILARSEIVPRSDWHAKTRWILAAAAAVAVIATALFFARIPGEDLSFAGFRSRMIGFAVREYRMDLFTSDLGELKKYLSARGAPADFTLPEALSRAPLKGGAALTWQGRPVSMVCFNSRENTTLYLFVIDRQAAAFSEISRFELYKNMPCATWTAGGKTFLFAGRVPEAELKALLQNPNA